MGKKIRSIMKNEEERFLKGAREKGYTKAQAQEIFNLIEPFAGYAFNKAHAVSYATIAYQTAYLKANYPEEYMLAVMMNAGTQQRVAEAFAECVRLGIAVLPPDVNRSGVNFALEAQPGGPQAIRFGLASVKNVGEGIAEGIIESREAAGPFSAVEDVFERVPVKHLNKRALESLAKAGAVDLLAERGALLASLDRLIAHGQRVQKQRESGQTSLFDLMAGGSQAAVPGPQLEAAREAPQQQKLAWEKELLGIYLSEHPFARAAAELRPHLTCGLDEVTAEQSGRDLVVGGIVTSTRTIATRDGRSFLAAEIEDLTGPLEITVWPEQYEQTRDLWLPGNIVIACIRVKARDERLQVSVQKAVLYGEEPFDPAAVAVEPAPARVNGNGNGYRNGREGAREPKAAPGVAGPSSLRIVLEETDDADGDHERLRALVNALREFSGEGDVRLSIRQRDGAEVEMELPKARYCPELTQLLGDIVGPWGTVRA
jgi:DNA polymerase-3 subunit alpha